MRNHKNAVRCLTLTYDSQYLFSSDDSGLINQYDIQNDTYHSYKNLHFTGVEAMAVSYDNQFLFTSDISANMKKIDISKKLLIKSYDKVVDVQIYGREQGIYRQDQGIKAMKITKDGKFLFIGCYMGLLCQWDVDSEVMLKNFQAFGGHKVRITSLCLSSDDMYLFTADIDGNQKKWDLHEQKLDKSYDKQHWKQIWSITITKDGKSLFTSDNEGTLKQWDTKLMKLTKNYGKIHNMGIASIFSP